MRLFRDESNDATENAQRNLSGRTNYVDPDSLRFHKSRIISADIIDHGLLFAIVESVALDHENRKRGFRPVIFDVFGTVIERPSLKESYSTSRAARNNLDVALSRIDAMKHTREAIEHERRSHEKQLQWFAEELGRLEKKIAA